MLLDTLTTLAADGQLSVSSAVVRHLPLVREAISELGLEAALEARLPPDPRMKVSDADCVLVMILNILHGRVALYKMSEWLEGTDMEVLFGAGVDGACFTDTRLGEALDRIAAAGTDDLLSAAVAGYLASDRSPSTYCVHQDTTSVKLYGAYGDWAEVIEPIGSPFGTTPPVPMRGFSKDKRPDLLQLVYGLSLQGAVGVPLCMSVLDGNASDQAANRFHIDRLAGLLPPKDEVTLVADCKLCDPDTLGRVLDAAFHFVTLVPRSYGVRDELVERVRLAGEDLPLLASGHQRRKSDPERFYRGRSFEASFPILDPETGSLEQRDLRFLVVASPALEAREEGAINARIDKERAKIDKARKEICTQTFACEDDAERAVAPLKKSWSFHTVEVRIASKEVEGKRRRGRPRKGERPPVETVWTVATAVTTDAEAVERARFHSRHFVLITDHLDAEAWSDERVLTTYREQHLIEGHRGFRWLKGPAAVAPAFLKKPQRIAAMGLVFILALMVRNYLEWAVRTAMAEEDLALPNYNRTTTKRPTAENVFYYFRDVRLILLCVDGETRVRQIEGMRPEGREVLRLLGWSEAVFTRPRRKMGFRGGEKAGM